MYSYRAHLKLIYEMFLIIMSWKWFMYLKLCFYSGCGQRALVVIVEVYRVMAVK